MADSSLRSGMFGIDNFLVRGGKMYVDFYGQLTHSRDAAYRFCLKGAELYASENTYRFGDLEIEHEKTKIVVNIYYETVH